MAETNYAFVKDGNVVNIAVFDDPTVELLDHFKEAHEVDNIVLATTKSVIGGTYDGLKFWLPQPYPSWIKNEDTNDWEAPVAYPTVDPENPKFYQWNEETVSWQEVVTAE